ncbi:MAG: GYD domain-containing protein [Betaproteobacteria bacterium]|nr:GYD domain-containing protein [Betaproteobacteria bacterium]MDE2002697.1 GYD domain-containing protein [Betaproteobacteria bacterium]MDE2210463.1 GYD domain-containing protein [Betaproteobacteria bacterium]
MATFIVLASFTDQGIRSVKETTKRADAAREQAKKMGITMKSIHWTIGSYDLVIEFDAPDDATMAAFAMATGTAGNIRTQTLRAFSKDEVTGMLAKVK